MSSVLYLWGSSMLVNSNLKWFLLKVRSPRSLSFPNKNDTSPVNWFSDTSKPNSLALPNDLGIEPDNLLLANLRSTFDLNDAWNICQNRYDVKNFDER